MRQIKYNIIHNIQNNIFRLYVFCCIFSCGLRNERSIKWSEREHMKKIFLMTVIFISMISFVTYGNVKPDYKAAILVEASTGKILYQYNKDEILPQASITKLMTYYVMKNYLREKSIKETDKITIGNTNFNIPEDGVKFGLKSGDSYTYGQLLQAMLVISANDIACEFQDIYDKSGGDIIAEMNKTSSALGLNSSYYHNVTGITITAGDGDGNKKVYNKSTAYELYKLAKIIINTYPEILNISSKKHIIINGNTYYNTNNLLSSKVEVDGLKTGHTDEAGYCLVFTADVKNIIGNGQPMRLIGVVLGCKNDSIRIKSSLKLLNYGENNFYNYKLVSKDDIFSIKNEFYKSEIMGNVANDIYLLKNKNTPAIENFKERTDFVGTVHKGDKIGTVSIKIGDNTINKAVYANDDYNQRFILLRILLYIKNFISNLIQ